ncbi:hypothetical protein BDV93DRAFT_606181 [Ceratobasidium sp. AG-I]|nr:hypothetical protein BDV93DRAFT_606181 [Ceratobasidium sp. AG-I]
MFPRKKRRTDLHSPAHFDLVVVGCGGGHDETNLSGYLLKPRNQSWDAGILGLEAGSGYGALKRLLSTTHPRLFASLFPSPTKSRPALSATDKAYAVYNSLRAFLLTHAHLDHAASLVISAGALPGPTKHILGAQRVLQDLETCIFSPGRCWPNIVGWGEHPDVAGENTTGGILRALPVASTYHDEARDRDDEYRDVGAGIEGVQVRVVPLAHGTSASSGHAPHPKDDQSNGHTNGCDQEGVYRSSAFFIRHTRTRHEFLFFGDVEADPSTPPIASQSTSIPVPTPNISNLRPSPSLEPASPTRPLLLPIWKHTAHLLVHSRLHTLLIECSWPAGRPTAQLFGHLGVEQLRAEMVVLAQEVVKARERVSASANIAKAEVESLVISDTVVPAAVPVVSANIKAGRPKTRRARTESPPRSGRGTKRKAVPPIPTPPLPPTAHIINFPTPTPPLSAKPSLLEQPPKLPSPLTNALTGLRVIVIHCKEPPPSFPLSGAPTIADYIVRQLRDGVLDLGIPPDETGVEWVAAHQGDEFDDGWMEYMPPYRRGSKEEERQLIKVLPPTLFSSVTEPTEHAGRRVKEQHTQWCLYTPNRVHSNPKRPFVCFETRPRHAHLALLVSSLVPRVNQRINIRPP